ncbi:MAG: minor capsid protein [Abditibacteriota bacterium]|nr:minor capsid protein [Abditibacteriota bacterium]
MPLVEKGQKLGVTIGREQAGALLESVGVTAGSMNRLNEDAFEAMIGMTQEGSPIREVLDKGAGYSIKEAVMNVLKDGIAQGKSPQEIAGEMMRLGYQDRRHALLVCRTETMRAYRISTKQTYEANGVERVIWAASESSATCAACWAMDGRAFDLDKMPNDHPNGRCTMIPVIDDEDEETWDSEERFKERLTEEEQKKILGPTRYELWKEGKLPWEDIPAVKPNETYGPTLGISPLKDGKAPELSEDVSGNGDVKFLNGSERGKRYEALKGDAGEQLSANVSLIERDVDMVAQITDEKINSVPKLDIRGLSDKQNNRVTKICKALLRCARRNNYSEETLFALNFDLHIDNIQYGDKNSVSYFEKPNHLMVIHNHPNDTSFSLDDYKVFRDTKIKHLLVVSNNGRVEVLSKTDNFSKDKMESLFSVARKLGKDNSSMQADIVGEMLSLPGAEEYGITRQVFL